MSNLEKSIADLESALVGKAIPNVEFKIINDKMEWNTLSSEQLFANKKVVLFALPGAFTPTCSTSHLPRYDELASTFKSEGIDDIYCLSVNDTFVMNAWEKAQNCSNITFLPDGNGDFSRGMGLLVKKDALGFGDRSWRYSILVNNLIIEKVFIEADVPGDPFEVSDADTMLNFLNPNATLPKKVSIIGKENCSHCERAKALLTSKGMDYELVNINQNGLSNAFLSGVSGALTTPQVFIDGELIGGADELEGFLK